MDSDKHLINILNKLAPIAQFTSEGHNISAESFRAAWASPIPALTRHWNFAQIARPQGFEELLVVLKSMFEPYVWLHNGDEYVGSNLGLIVAGVGTPTTLDRFTESVLTSAVLIGSDHTVSLLKSWVANEPIRYTRYTVLNGIQIEDDRNEFPIEEGFSIARLPKGQKELLDLQTPEMWVGTPMSMMGPPLGAPQIYGAPAIVVEMTCGPVFNRGDDDLSYTPVAQGPCARLGAMGLESPLFAGLSLACGSAVSPSCAWSNIDEALQSFLPWARLTPNHIVLYGSGGAFPAQPPTLTDATLTHSIKLAGKIAEYGLGDKTRTALARWLKSFQGSVADQFIDLRIALEVLYAPGSGSGDIAYRLQSRGARHMASSFEDRKAIAKEIKDFYYAASGFAHGRIEMSSGNNSISKKLPQLLRARNICRDALIKIINENMGLDIDVDHLTLA